MTYIHDDAQILGDVQIGDGCFLHPGCVIDGTKAPVILQDGVIVQEKAVIRSQLDASISIGNNSMIETAATVSCSIGPNCYIRARASLSAGAEIGHHCVVGEHVQILDEEVLGDNSVNVGVPQISFQMPYDSAFLESELGLTRSVLLKILRSEQ